MKLFDAGKSGKVCVHRRIQEPFRTLIWVIPVAGGMVFVMIWAMDAMFGK